MQVTGLTHDKFDEPDATPPNLIGHYVGLFSRLVAFVIDALIIAVALAIVPWLLQILMDSTGLASFTTQWMAGVERLLASGIFAVFFTYAYYAFFWFFAGMTIGDAVMGIRIIRTNGKRVGPFRSLIRLIGYSLSMIPLGLGFFWILIDDRRQGWHDKLAGTFAVYAWEARPEERLYTRGLMEKLPASVLEHIKLPSPEIDHAISMHTKSRVR
jgi:uncharacterized RDD family membrane protein YckC